MAQGTGEGRGLHQDAVTCGHSAFLRVQALTGGHCCLHSPESEPEAELMARGPPMPTARHRMPELPVRLLPPGGRVRPAGGSGALSFWESKCKCPLAKAAPIWPMESPSQLEGNLSPIVSGHPSAVYTASFSSASGMAPAMYHPSENWTSSQLISAFSVGLKYLSPSWEKVG